ncbi:MAG: septal ring lytic transglycosylase RlpA family protein [Spirochaetales bacterium]|jgi:rare lipoprotein A|nr:septal ring lytic transglycosylase RlpA family protein [Spirochaetales bacterium]
MKGKILKTGCIAACLVFYTVLSASAFDAEGFASWYGGKFQGRKTANGEVFDTNKLTAAHKTLAFGTKVKVTDTESGKFVIVRINDRGPFVDDRIIDLSKAAADIIGLTSRGVAHVRLEVVEAEQPASPYLTIQVASFGDQENAMRLRNRLFESALAPSIETTDAGIFRVLLEHVPEENLDTVKGHLASLGYGQIMIRR